MSDESKTETLTVRTAEERLAALETSVAQLYDQVGMILVMVASGELSERFVAKAGAWPSRDAAIHAFAEKSRIEVLQAIVAFAREDIARSEVGGDGIGKLMVRAAERVEAALRARGEELGAALIEHADAIDALAAPPPPAPKEE